MQGWERGSGTEGWESAHCIVLQQRAVSSGDGVPGFSLFFRTCLVFLKCDLYCMRHRTRRLTPCLQFTRPVSRLAQLHILPCSQFMLVCTRTRASQLHKDLRADIGTGGGVLVRS